MTPAVLNRCQLLVAGALAIALGAACTTSGGSGDEPCQIDGLERCVGSELQECVDGAWSVSLSCDVEQRCDEELGCVDCYPQWGDTCRGDDAVGCNSDGTYGDLIESCTAGGCINGECSDDCSADGAEAIYALAASAEGQGVLYRVNPNASSPFTPVATVDCAPCTPSDSPTTCAPIAMAIDRDTQVWLSYSSGDLFRLDPATAECTFVTHLPSIAPPEAPADSFELFRIAFATDRAGSNHETMYIVGGSWDGTSNHLGILHLDELTMDYVGSLGAWLPDLTGTGHGELFGFDDGLRELSQIDTTTSERSVVNAWPQLDVGAAQIVQWRGAFYLFTNTTGPLGLNGVSHVYRLDADNGGFVDVVPNHDYRTRAVATSTCAPRAL